MWDKIEQDRFQFIFLYIYTLCGYHRHACRYETMIYIKFIRRFNRIKHSHTHSNLSFLRKVYSCHEIKDYVYCFFLIFIFTGCLQILELKKSITCMRLNESNQWKSLQQLWWQFCLRMQRRWLSVTYCLFPGQWMLLLHPGRESCCPGGTPAPNRTAEIQEKLLNNCLIIQISWYNTWLHEHTFQH